MLCDKPRTANETALTPIRVPKTREERFQIPMNLYFAFCIKFFDRLVVNVKFNHLSLFIKYS